MRFALRLLARQIDVRRGRAGIQNVVRNEVGLSGCRSLRDFDDHVFHLSVIAPPEIEWRGQHDLDT